MNTLICKIVLLVIALANSVHNYDSVIFPYTVPEPQIQAFSPRGLRVSIPNHPGINLFAFHGNINRGMVGLEAGQLSKDILKTEQNEWVFQDPYIKLKIGDKIYYWLFVIKDGLGYRYDNGVYEVKEISPTQINGDYTLENTEERGENSTEKYKFIISSCEKLILNLTETFLGLQSEVDSLRQTDNILRDIVEKLPNASNSLTMSGASSLYDDPVSMVQEVIGRKLNLPIKVIRAEVQGDGTTKFEVKTLNEKVAIIKAAKANLKNSKIFIYY